MRHNPIHLRGHHILCLFGFQGMGYSEEFVQRMAGVQERIRSFPETPVRVDVVADEICEPCPHRGEHGCARRGLGSEWAIQRMDREVLSRLGLDPGAALPARELFALAKARIAPEALPEICRHCQWLAYGVCEEGLRECRI